MAANDEKDLIRRAKAGDPIAKNELIQKYRPMLRHKIQAYSRAPVPMAALQGEAMRLLLHAIERFDPSKNIQFKTFLDHNLRGLYRYTSRAKNVARIPEHQTLQITTFKNVKSILESKKGREPTAYEVADALAWSPAQVVKMETALSRRDIAASGIEAMHGREKFEEKMEDLMEYEYFEMMPEEKIVFDYTLGRHGKPRLEDVKAMSRRTGLSIDKVYEIKRNIAQRISKRIG
jgi:DNA-directed RNA polymerase specialized sigma subunit